MIKRINITLDEYTLGVLDKFANPRSISRSQLIRLAIPEYIRNHTYLDKDGNEIHVPTPTYIDKYKENIMDENLELDPEKSSNTALTPEYHRCEGSGCKSYETTLITGEGYDDESNLKKYTKWLCEYHKGVKRG